MSTKKTTKLVWRLANRPTPDEVAALFDKGLLTKDEAREILFSLETEEDRTGKSLKEEIKFLRELIQKLSTNKTVIIETIREVEKPWKKYDWYQPYHMYSTSGTSLLSMNGSSVTNAAYNLSASAGALTGQLNDAQSLASNSAASDFTSIQTF